MTALLVAIVIMLVSLSVAMFVGRCIGDQPDASDLHDGATMRAQRAERYRQAREQENAAAAEFDKFGRGTV